MLATDQLSASIGATGYPLRPGITFTYLGVKVNPQARVLMRDGSRHATSSPPEKSWPAIFWAKAISAGFGMVIGTVFGRLAGKEAARFAS